MSTRVARPILIVGLLVLIAIFPRIVTSDYWLNLTNLAISLSIASLGLTIVLGYAGRLSLAQAAFWGIGAYTTALLTVNTGAPVWLGMLAGLLVTGLFGVLLGIPALKLTGHYLAMATIGFGIIVQLILVNSKDYTNGSDGIGAIPSPTLGPLDFSTPTSFFYLAAVALLIFTWAAIRLKGSRVGRAMLAIRENEIAAETMGISTTRYKVMAFALSAAFGGFAGTLFAHSGSHYISPDTFSFDESVVILAMTVLGGNGSAIGAIIGTVLLTFLPEGLRFLKDSYIMVYAAAIVAIMIFMPGGIAGLVAGFGFSRRLRDSWNANVQVPESELPPVAGAGEPAHLSSMPSNNGGPAAPLLTLRGLAKHFGGLKAVDGVDMQVTKGEIHALIGPNGSGKTTILNVVSGLYRPTGGVIDFDGKNIAHFSPHRITESGMARTFQNIRLFGDLTAEANVMIGQHGRTHAGLIPSLLHLPSQQKEEAAMRAKAREVLAFVGLAGKEHAQAQSLPYGQQRLLELARALATEPKVLLLDEPAAGLNSSETEKLIDLLYQIRDRGVTILLVEHDMSLVMNVSDKITVINFGKKIAEGSAEEIETNPQVIDAYLGTEAINAA